MELITFLNDCGKDLRFFFDTEFFRCDFDLIKEYAVQKNVFDLKKAFGELEAPFSALRLCPEENVFFSNFFENQFQVGEKRFSSLMRIPSGIFRHCKLDKRLTKVSLAYLKKRF